MKKTMVKLSGTLLFCALLLLLISCNNTKREWENAQQENSIEAYEDFIQNHPKSEHIDEAKKLRDDLMYKWKDGFLSRNYPEEKDLVQEAFSIIINEKNSMIVGMDNISNGSIVTFLCSLDGAITFTDQGAEGSVQIQVMNKYDDEDFILGLKVNDGDKNASMQLHQAIVKKIEMILEDER